MDYFARLMTFCSMRWNDPSYYDAWVESYDASTQRNGDHSFAQTTQYVPWAQAMTWNARLAADGRVVVRPLPIGSRAPERGWVMTPQGPQEVRRTAAGTNQADENSDALSVKI
jgi:hypothetical protein